MQTEIRKVWHQFRVRRDVVTFRTSQSVSTYMTRVRNSTYSMPEKEEASTLVNGGALRSCLADSQRSCSDGPSDSRAHYTKLSPHAKEDSSDLMRLESESKI